MPWHRQSVWVVAQYHLRETALRWAAQPASPLARWFLTFALAALAGVLLLGFAAAESARRSELRQLGLDTIVIQTPSLSVLPEIRPLPPDHWAGPLRTQGELIFLQQLPEPAYTAAEEPMPAFAASFQTVATLTGPGPARANSGVEGVWLTRAFPAGQRAQLRCQGSVFPVVTATPAGPWEALGLADCTIVPAAPAPGATAQGRIDWLLFTPNSRSGGPPLLPTIHRLYSADGESAPIVRDPSPYRAALEIFTQAQDRWRRGMAVLLGACVLLVFVSIGMLEEKQTRYTQALLRSLGVPAAALFGFSAVENLILANSALAAALAGSRMAAKLLLTLAGAGTQAALHYDPAAIALLFGAINGGAALSLIPLLIALRRPIGVVLA